MKPDREPVEDLVSRLNEARALVFELHRLGRRGPGLPPTLSTEVEGVGSDLLHIVASTDLPVLLWGASGPTGPAIARFIHDQSPWSAGSFVHLRAASLKRDDIGRHLVLPQEPGDGSGKRGTLYLDEIISLLPEVQQELTGYLEPHHEGACGSSLPVRLISSTSRSLEAALDTRALSERLYFLLARILIPVRPAKQNRRVPAIHRHFATWILAQCRRLQGSRDGELYPYFLRLLQGPLIQIALERTGGNQVQAARLLGVNRNTLRKWIRRLEESHESGVVRHAGIPHSDS
jgi:two-component system nitrogen regulation response regulator GlnG